MDNLWALRSAYSTPRAHANGRVSAKKYRWHLTLEGNQWVVWSSWGPAATPDRSRSPLGASADIYEAVAIMQHHVDSKSCRRRDPYLGIDDRPVAIDPVAIEQLAFAQL
jgi:hypothetical protein